jgi:hypothetical protein
MSPPTEFSISYLDALGELDLYYKYKLYEEPETPRLIGFFKAETRSENENDINLWYSVLDTIFAIDANETIARQSFARLENNVINADFLARIGKFLKKLRTNKKNYIGDVKDKKIVSLMNELNEKDKIIHSLRQTGTTQTGTTQTGTTQTGTTRMSK